MESLFAWEDDESRAGEVVHSNPKRAAKEKILSFETSSYDKLIIQTGKGFH